MVQFEKYLSRDMNVINSMFFEIKLKTNSSVKAEFEEYKNDSLRIKNMFLINEAEKEIQQNKRLKTIENLTDIFLKTNTSDTKIHEFLEIAY